jgi:hypothetical protein
MGECEISIVVVLSRGEEGYIIDSDGKRLSDMKIVEMFSNQLAPNLAGRPKLFIFSHFR